MDWLSKDLWRAHVSWLTPPWVGATEEGRKDFDAKCWMDQIQSAHYRTLIFYTKFHDGYCTFPSKYSKIQPERDFFGECAAEAHKRGMRILTYYSVVLDQLIGKEHPDWQVVGREGKPQNSPWLTSMFPGAYCCINNPGYREVVLGQLTELRDNYKPDGFWLDVLGPLLPENCFCQYCQAKYKEEIGGGSLFETTDNLWYQSCFVELMKEIRGIVKKNDPDCVLGQNFGVRIPEIDKLVDFFTHESINASTISSMCRSMRSGDKPFESTYRLYTSVGSYALRGPDRVLLESLATVVHGGACSIELSPTHTGQIMDEPVNRLIEVGKYIREIEPYLLNSEPVYDVAIFQREIDTGWQRPAGWDSVLVERDIPFAILYQDADLSPYRLLILDDIITLDEGLAKKLTNYVSEGGNLIVEGGAARFGTPAGNILSEALGITAFGKTGYPAHYLSGLDKCIANDMGEDDLIVEGDAYKIGLTTAKALAYYRYEFAERAPDKNIYCNLPPKRTRSDDPAITINHYGKGKAMYIGCPLCTTEICAHKDKDMWGDFREYPIQLAANLARFMINEPLLRGTTPAGVEVIVNLQNGRHIVHLLNHYVGVYFYDNRRGILKLADVPVAINERRIGQIRRAFHVLGHKKIKLTIQRNEPWAEVRIPELKVHALIVLEH